MTELQHAVVGISILMVIWLGFAKQYFKSPKDEQSWEKWKDMFRKER